ncbi:toll-like receptor 13 [Salarias fasciatus]|uniref:Toll-like receptor 13 n=1 Tax=Salarias fasciatus TaxID=181472 RepID=A0A672FJH0_SALFA|nr:toll-like receptor 13 [Salarias fasciatus]
MAPSRLLLLASQLLLLLGFSQPYFLTNCSLSHGSSPVWAVAVDCGGRQLLSVPADLPPGTTSLFFSYNRLQAVSRLDFRSMRRLRRLVLSYNRIARVEQGSFLHQGALETLDLSYNLLCNLTENMFQGLSNLTRLDLSSNQIRVLHPIVFRLLTSVHTVLLESNLLRRVEDVQPLLLLPNIHSLKLASNLFTSFQSSDLPLTQSSALETLDLSSCRLLESFGITTPVFPCLRCLDLSMSGVQSGLRWDVTNRTFLRSVSQLSFNEPLLPLDNVLHVLQSLDSLAEVQLNYVEDWIRGGLLDTLCLIPTLRTLVLVYNHLGRSTLGLARCSQLSILDLSWTYLRTLPEGSVRSMKRLKVLRLQTNFLTEVPKDVGRLVSLRTLDLNDNLISELRCGDFGDAAGLTDLDLGTNRIAKLDGCAFQNLTRLRTLDLSHNLLWTYGGTFRTGLQSLERLDLSRGFLFILHNGDFQGLRSLRYLDVSSDHIGRVQQKAFGGLKDLETLTVSIPLDYECNFRGLRRLRNLTVYLSTDRGQTRPPRASPQALYELRSLKTFTVVCRGFHFGIPLEPPEELLQTMPGLEAFAAINAFTSAPRPDTFRYLPRLQNLTLGKTDLSDLEPELFHFVPDLQTLDLSETSLRSLDFLSGADLFRLRSLSLRDNRLVTVNHTVLRSLPALVQLDLTGNPFACDCSNAAFIEWAKTNNQTQVVNAHEYGCAFPPSRHGARLMDFDTQSCFLDLGLVCFASSGALVVLTLLASFVHHFLRWQMLYAYRLFLAFLYDRRRKRAGPERYDAFVSYNVHDEDWVYRHLLPELEGRQGWRLCLHHRDFQPGRPILENITDAIYSSRKTLCVVSRRYLQSEWCSREVQMASFRLFDEQKDVLVLLFLEDIPSRYLSPYHRMRRLVKRRTYLSWTQAASHPGLFWDNVRRALETGDGPGQDAALLTGVPDPRQGPE